MKLVVISGRSGSGKSTALNVLEDAGCAVQIGVERHVGALRVSPVTELDLAGVEPAFAQHDAVRDPALAQHLLERTTLLVRTIENRDVLPGELLLEPCLDDPVGDERRLLALVSALEVANLLAVAEVSERTSDNFWLRPTILLAI